MKRIFISSVAALAMASSITLAEENGIFIGVGLGYNGTQHKMEGPADDAGGTFSDKYNFGGLSYEIIAGYKQFFTPKFGARYYANFAYADTKKKIEDVTEKIKVMDFGVNADALYNFVSSERLDFGAFLGLGLGANNYNVVQGDKKTGFNVAINVGLRTLIAQHHGIELAARVPFLTTTITDKDGYKEQARQTYNVGVRYVFNF